MKTSTWMDKLEEKIMEDVKRREKMRRREKMKEKFKKMMFGAATTFGFILLMKMLSRKGKHK